MNQLNLGSKTAVSSQAQLKYGTNGLGCNRRTESLNGFGGILDNWNNNILSLTWFLSTFGDARSEIKTHLDAN